jgi:hypothetical protein
MTSSAPKLLVALLSVACLAALCDGAEPYGWQETYARVVPTGDLAWDPQPFVFETGDAVRYIDYEGGDDANAGTSKEQPWKHHPWDPQATGRAKADRGADTYVFKCGVAYRGGLVCRESGTSERPIRLTSDPFWGGGDAVLSGSEVVTGWRKGSPNRDIPNPGQVWVADLNYLPRRVWTVDADGTVTRIPIARTPNWQVSDPEEVLSEWWQWENPQWWVAANRTTTVNGQAMHLGIDTKHLTQPPEYYRDAIVWSEWAIVMGTPFPSKVAAYDPVKKAVAFEGRWYGAGNQINAGNRYFLENKPQYLDAPGEFWFERTGDGGRLHIRLPDDRDPNTVTVEAARRYNLIQDLASANSPNRLDVLRPEERDRVDTTGVSHIVISGLTFRFSNAWWDYDFAPWMHKEVNNAGVCFRGSCDDVRISNCRFEYVSKGVRIDGIDGRTHSGSILVSDNDIRYTDDAAITIGRGGSLADVRVLRNNLFMIGMRPFRQSDAHALTIGFPQTMEVAGNMLKRCYGSGVFVHGGKPSGAGGEVPLARNLIHHNKAEQTLLAANDWGGIETWQGGPFYIYDNISADPNGYWNWAANKPFNARLGFAYYLDGGFKNYLFNNIAWGLNNEANSKLCNAAAFYEAVGTIHNSYINNTVYRFATGSNWSPSGGHHRFLGNVWSDISDIVFMHGRLKEDTGQPAGSEYPHGLMVYGHNVFYAIGNLFGVFEMSGKGYSDFRSFQQALAARNTLDPSLGLITDRQPLRDPANRDMRPADGSAAIDQGVKYFVPWGLASMVGEWNFYHAGGDVTQIPDEHWFMADYYRARETYGAMPQYPLTVVNVTQDNYVQGDLEDWIAGALRLNGTNQYAFVSHEAMMQPVEFGGRRGGGGTASGEDLRNLDIHDSSFVLEIYFRTESGAAEGVLIRKMDAQAGYALTVNGVVALITRSGGTDVSVSGSAMVNDGEWHHVLVEADREAGRVRIYVDGVLDAEGDGPAGPSLSNGADFYVGGTPDGNCLAATIDFARVCLGSLADAKTTIEELYAWEFDGPFLRDFAGALPNGARRDAGAIEYQPGE